MARQERLSRLSALRRVLIVAVVLASLLNGTNAHGATSCSITWDGGAGTSSWFDGANWDAPDTTGGNRLPSIADDVCIPDLVPDVTVELDQAQAVEIHSIDSQQRIRIDQADLTLDDGSADASKVTSLKLAGGSLGGAGWLDVTVGFSWSDGRLGRTNDPGRLVVLAGASVELGGSSSHVLDWLIDSKVPVIIPAGVAVTLDWDWTDGGHLISAGELLIEGTLEVAKGSFGGQPVVIGPAGKVHITGDAYSDWIENEGKLQVESGNLRARQIKNVGSIELGPGGYIAGWEGQGFSLENYGLVVAGTRPGEYDVVGLISTNTGVVRVTSGRLIFGGDYRDTLSGRLEADGGATLEVQGSPDLSGVDAFVGPGTIELPGNTTISGTLAMEGGVSMVMPPESGSLGGSQRITGDGRFVWQGGSFAAGTTTIDPGVTFVGGSSAPYDQLHATSRTFVNNGTLVIDRASIRDDGGSAIENEGILASTGWSATGPPISGSGEIRAETGTLQIGGSYVNDGMMSIAPRAVIEVTGDYTQSSNGTYEPSVQAGFPPASGRLVVDGTAALAGALAIDNATAIPGIVKVLHAATRAGTFGSVEGPYTLTYDTADAWLSGDESTQPEQIHLSIDPPVTTDWVWRGRAPLWVNFSVSDQDAHSVAGYSWVWDHDAAGSPDLVEDMSWGQPYVYTTPPEGQHVYFHVRAESFDGNWTSAATLGPLKVDLTPPTPVTFLPGEVDQLFQTDRDIQLAWTRPRDVTSGLQWAPYGLVIHQTRDDASRESWSGTEPGLEAETWVVHASPGFTYCFTVLANDRAGNESPAGDVRCTDVPFDDVQLRADGVWQRDRGPGYYLGTYSQSIRQGSALVRAHVHARRLFLVATRCPSCGRVAVWMGDRKLATVDLYASRTAKQRIIRVGSFQSPHVADVRLVVVSSGKPVDVEGLVAERN